MSTKRETISLAEARGVIAEIYSDYCNPNFTDRHNDKLRLEAAIAAIDVELAAHEGNAMSTERETMKLARVRDEIALLVEPHAAREEWLAALDAHLAREKAEPVYQYRWNNGKSHGDWTTCDKKCFDNTNEGLAAGRFRNYETRILYTHPTVPAETIPATGFFIGGPHASAIVHNKDHIEPVIAALCSATGDDSEDYTATDLSQGPVENTPAKFNLQSHEHNWVADSGRRPRCAKCGVLKRD